jgi:hypothetical protein|nr:hypothetical protein [Kofleriaceae bacterium]
MGTMTVPSAKADVFETGAREAIDALWSQQFQTELAAFMTAHGSDDDIAGAWTEHDPAALATHLRASIAGTELSTFGGVGGLYDKLRYHTIAMDGGGSDTPVEYDRWSLGDRASPSIANTIAHEVAHHIGLHHPHMGGRPEDKSWPTALCEPPYLIGSLVEKIAAGPTWRWSSSGDCRWLAPPAH